MGTFIKGTAGYTLRRKQTFAGLLLDARHCGQNALFTLVNHHLPHYHLLTLGKRQLMIKLPNTE